MPRRVLEDSKLVVERDAIPVNGVEYDIRGPEDMSMRMTEQLIKLQDERERLVEDPATEASELMDVMLQLLDIVFVKDENSDPPIIPPDVETLKDVPYRELGRWFDFFMNRSEMRARVELQKVKNRAMTRSA